MRTTDYSKDTATKLNRIAWLSKRDKQKQFNWLMHHYNVNSLKECFQELKGKKALGIDGINKQTYERNLDENILNLTERMKAMAYTPGPVREVLIPKGNGKTRPLGISNFEDKIVQKMTAKILEGIYEPLFVEKSFGFRPGRSCHMAIKSLHQHLFCNEIETVIDVDLKNFFGTINQDRLRELIEEKIKDTRFIRYLVRMFKAGVLSNGDLKMSEEGVPQGSICSPILANIYAHYAIDLWMEEMIKPNCRGKVEMFRYADDLVICCETEYDAIRIKKALEKRLERSGLELNVEKTKLIPFSKAKAREGIKQGSFDFLGFTFFWGRSRKGIIIPKLKTNGKAMRSKLKNVNKWGKSIRNRLKLREIWKLFSLKLRGHINYYGVSMNTKYVERFIEKATRIMFYWLNRRSQKNSFSWEKYEAFCKGNPLPCACVKIRLF